MGASTRFYSGKIKYREKGVEMADFNPSFLIELDEADFEKATKRADDLGLLSNNKSGRRRF